MDKSEHETSLELNASGRSIVIDTMFYSVTVNGDPEDDLEEIKETTFDVADRIQENVKELDDNLSESDDKHYS